MKHVMHGLARAATQHLAGPALAVPAFLRRFGPHGGARTIPVAEYERARAAGRLDVQRQFYSGLLLRNGVYKTTNPNRMNDLFPMLTSMASQLAPRPLRVLDVACSSGTSTVEMQRAFANGGIPCEAWGTDLMLWVRHVSRSDGCAILFDRDEQPIQVEVAKWATPWQLRPRDRLLRPRLSARARRLLDHELGAFREALRAPVPGYSVRRVTLLSSLTENAEGVHFVEEDILDPQAPGPFAVVRAANILNLGYFSADTLRRMVAALCARIAPGGLLLVTRTEGSAQTNRGTLFRWSGTGLEVEVTTNGGSEITDLVT
jgi:hypothetical protein